MNGKRYFTRTLHSRIIITGNLETVKYIKSHFPHWNATVRKKGKKWIFDVVSIPEVLLFAYQLLPHVKSRKKDLQEVIRAIENWASKKLNQDFTKDREIAYEVYDIKRRIIKNNVGIEGK